MAEITLKDLDADTRRRLAELNPELADQIDPPPTANPRPPSTTTRSTTTRSTTPTPTRAPTRKPAGKRRTRSRKTARAAASVATAAAPAGASSLLLYAASATFLAVILVQLLSPGGSRAVSTVITTVTTAFRKLADPADPLIPAA